ncbi:Peptidase S8 and S53 subtilisin kexin sedolisin [uncultured Paludibacter sp.]|nr:Peptidase S8 and S53 subtilisin kexin sedolisin [uncultured Paludibacter sp.]
MKKLLILAIAGFVLISCQKEDVKIIKTEKSSQTSVVTSQVIPGKYVVVYNSIGIQRASKVAAASGNVKIEPQHILSLTKQILTESGIEIRTPEFTYSNAIKGVALELTESEAVKLAESTSVKGVYPDMMVNFGLPEVSITGKPTPAPAQSIPWGITRIGGSSDGTGKTAWIIDTGIDLDHPDLNVDQTRGKNFINTSATPDDDNGHGTHCAGIVAALNNSIGVVGVAAGATVVPVKVLDKRGSGAYSVIIAGLDYVATNAKAGDAANMSLGGSAYQPIDDAVLNLAAKGIKIALAAGNESQNANNCSPARVNGTNIYTVSAMGTGDLWASYSNYANPPIDFCAPGSSIYSTYKGGTYATLSGTSMATPHVCGLLLLGNIQTDGYVKNDPDGNADPIAHK